MDNRFFLPPALKVLLTGVALAALSACASVEPNQNIVDAQARLSSAYNDKMTAERGQGDLANAKSSLGSAQTDWSNGEKERSNHELNMATTYLDLAETRGRQASVERDTMRLNQQAQIAGKNATIAAQSDAIAGQTAALAAKDQQIASQDTQIASRDTQIAAKDAELSEARDHLREYDMTTTDLGSTMVLQDVSFETGKSDLLPGGVNRLQALINYLRLSPNTRVRIEGYTDSVGGASYNQQLSLARANAVKGILSGANIDGGRIDTFGSGLDKPVASNATVSGRQANRRVEITLLKQPGV